MNYAIMCEAAEFKETVVVCEDMLMESVATGSSNFDALNENVFNTIIEKVKKFFKKIVEFVKGIIVKLKAFFYKMTNNTEKWIDLMEDKITDAVNRSGSDKFKYSMYEYDENWIITGMKGCIQQMMSVWGTDPLLKNLQTNKAESDIKQIMMDFKTKTTNTYIGKHTEKAPIQRDESGKIMKGSGKKDETRSWDENRYKDSEGKAAGAENLDNENVKKAMAKLEEDVDKLKDDEKDWSADKADRIAGFFGVTGGSSEDSIWAAVAKKARKDASEKKSIEIKSRALQMVGTLKRNPKLIDDIKKAYDDHLKLLEKVHSGVEKAGATIKIENESEVPSNLASSIGTYYRAYYDATIAHVSFYENATNKAKDLNISLLKEMTQAYMGALNKFAGVKEVKSST